MPLPSHLTKADNDLSIVYVGPTSPTDPRVPEAGAHTLDNYIALLRNKKAAMWNLLPKISSGTGIREITVQGTLLSGFYSSPLLINCTIEVPALESNVAIVSREDYLSLIVICAEVGAEHDSLLGQVPFSYRVAGEATIQQATKENTRRLRVFWLLSISASPLTSFAFINSLPADAAGDSRITIANQDNVGFALGPIRYYAKDKNWVSGKSYAVFTQAVEVVPIGRIRRLQNFPIKGYVWGNGGEEKIDPTYHILPDATLQSEGTNKFDVLRRKMYSLMSGQPGAGFAYNRSVQNLTAGSVAGNPGKPGESSGSPNGSVCLSNGQRTTFTNQAWTQTYFVQAVTAGNDGNGNAVLAIALNANSPSGTSFSDRKENHKIYSFSGTEEASLGTFSNLGGTGSLVWIGSPNSSIKPGSQALFVPAISYPSGSGFSLPYAKIEKAWLNGQQISSTNILRGYSEDLMQYADPVNNEQYFVVSGEERAAIHYLYKKVSITSDGSGTVSIPSGELGCFAFIKTITGRLDTPIYKGLAANTKYDALIYYTPRTLESWQFQMSYVSYQGLGQDALDFIDGATIASAPLFFATSQGGGCSVYRGEGALQYIPVAMHLPSLPTGIPVYTLDTPLQMQNESYAGPVTTREISAIPGIGLTFPSPGTVLKIQKESQIFEKSVSLTLSDRSNVVLGFYAPPLASRRPYLAVTGFLVEKDGKQKLIVATKSTNGDESIPLSVTQNTAIDLFNL